MLKRLFRIKNKEDWDSCNYVQECTMRDIPAKLEKYLLQLLDQKEVLRVTGIRDRQLEEAIDYVQGWINFWEWINNHVKWIPDLIPLKWVYPIWRFLCLHY